MVKDTGIAEATSNLASVMVVKGQQGSVYTQPPHRGQLYFMFVIDGVIQVLVTGQSAVDLPEGSSIALPSSDEMMLRVVSEKAEMLLVQVPE